jgi:hypothetical protein
LNELLKLKNKKELIESKELSEMENLMNELEINDF